MHSEQTSSSYLPPTFRVFRRFLNGAHERQYVYDAGKRKGMIDLWLCDKGIYIIYFVV